MPITPAYTWKESPNWVSIHVTLQSLSPSSLHILTTDSYVKINSYPYLFQADLFADVDNARSNAIIENNVVKFFLFKRKEELWGRLTAVGEKEDILSRREKSMELARQHASKMKEDAKLKCAKLGRLAVHNQIKLEEDKRKIIESRKEVELNQEREDIQHWQEEFQSEHDSSKVISNGSENKNGGTTLGDSDHFDVDKAENSRERKEMMYFCGKSNENKHDINKMVNKHDLTEPHENKGVFNSTILTSSKESVSDQPILPAPRKNMCITVKFSPKSLPPKLPARESRDEKVCFKENNTTPSDAIDVSEREPLFLFDKGNKFYRNGDMRSAINAYTDAIKKDPSLFIFANRAACHLHMQHFDSCIDDCTAVLNILQEGKMHEAHEEKLLQLLLSFGTSSPRIGESRPEQERELSATVEFIKKAAFELLSSPKSNVTGKSEEHLHSSMNDCTLFVVLARRGFAKCSLKDTEGSKSDFAKTMHPWLWQRSFANRAACHLCMQHFDSCINDCTDVLKILKEGKMHESHEEKLLQLLCSFGTSSPGTGKSRPDQERELSAKVELIKKAAFKLLSSPKSSSIGKSEEILHSSMNDCTFFVVLAHRGFAKCLLKDTEGSKSDLTNALNLDANCPEIEYVYTTVQRSLSGIEN